MRRAERLIGWGAPGKGWEFPVPGAREPYSQRRNLLQPSPLRAVTAQRQSTCPVYNL